MSRSHTLVSACRSASLAILTLWAMAVLACWATVARAGAPLWRTDLATMAEVDPSARLAQTPGNQASVRRLARGVLPDGTALVERAWGGTLSAMPFEPSSSPGRSAAGVDLVTGSIVWEESDLQLSSAGPGWPIGRMYGGESVASGSAQGRGWFQAARPELLFEAAAASNGFVERAYLIYGPHAYAEFARDTSVVPALSVFRGTNGVAGVLTRLAAGDGEPEVWSLVDTSGLRMEFFGWNAPAVNAGVQGQLWRVVDADGAVAAVGHPTLAINALGGFVGGRAVRLVEALGSLAGSGNVGRVWREYALGYSPTPIGGATRLLSVVVRQLERSDEGAWAEGETFREVAAVIYRYDTQASSTSQPGDLRGVFVRTLLRPGQAAPAPPAGGGDAGSGDLWLVTRRHYQYELTTSGTGATAVTQSRLVAVIGAEGLRAAHFASGGTDEEWSDPSAAVSVESTAVFGVNGAAGGVLEEAAELLVWYRPDGSVAATRSAGSCACPGGTGGSGALGARVEFERLAELPNQAPWARQAGYQPEPRFVAVVKWPAQNLSTVSPDVGLGERWEVRTFDEAGQGLGAVVSEVPVLSGGQVEFDASRSWSGGVVRDASGLVAAELSASSSVMGSDLRVVALGSGVRRVYTRESDAAKVWRGYALSASDVWGAGGAGSSAPVGTWTFGARSVSWGGVSLVRPLMVSEAEFGVDLEQGEVTAFDHKLYHGSGNDPASLAVRYVVTTLPRVTTDRNGSGEAEVHADVLDASGRPVVHRSALGRFDVWTYDPALGELVRSESDAVAVEPLAQAAPWPAVAAGQSGDPEPRVTTLKLDALGRVDGVELPDGRAGSVVRRRTREHLLVELESAPVEAPGGTGGAGAMAWGLPLSYGVYDHAGNQVVDALAGTSETTVEGTTSTPPEQWLASDVVNSRLAPGLGGGLSLQELSERRFSKNGALLREAALLASATDAPGLVTRYTHAPDGRLARVERADGTVRVSEVDELGRTRKVRGGVNTSTTPGGGTLYDLVTMHYEVAASVGGSPRGSPAPRLVKTAVDAPSAGSASERTQVMHFDARERVVGIEQPQPPHAAWRLDNLGRVVEAATYGQPGVGSVRTGETRSPSGRVSYAMSSYDQLGRVWRTRDIRPDVSTANPGGTLDPDQYTESTSWFDAHGREVVWAGSSIEHRRFSRHDEVTQSTTLAALPATLPHAAAIALDPATMLAIDTEYLVREPASGRVAARVAFERFPEPVNTGRGIVVPNPASGWTRPVYSSNGFSVPLRNGTMPIGVPDVQFFGYDAHGRRRLTVDAGNAGEVRLAGFDVDSNGDTVAAPPSHALPGAPSINYNPLGYCLGISCPQARREEWAFDGFGRERGRNGPDSAERWEHDALGRLKKSMIVPEVPRESGQRCVPVDPFAPMNESDAQKRDYEYDDRGRLKKERFRPPGVLTPGPEGDPYERMIGRSYPGEAQCAPPNLRPAIDGGMPLGMYYTPDPCSSGGSDGIAPLRPMWVDRNFLGEPMRTWGLDGTNSQIERDITGRVTRIERLNELSGLSMRVEHVYGPDGRLTTVTRFEFEGGQMVSHATAHIERDAWGNVSGLWSNPEAGSGGRLAPGFAGGVVMPARPGGSSGEAVPAPFGMRRAFTAMNPVGGGDTSQVRGWSNVRSTGFQLPGYTSSGTGSSGIGDFGIRYPAYTGPWSGVPGSRAIDYFTNRTGETRVDPSSAPGGGLDWGKPAFKHNYRGIDGPGWDDAPSPRHIMPRSVPDVPTTTRVPTNGGVDLDAAGGLGMMITPDQLDDLLRRPYRGGVSAFNAPTLDGAVSSARLRDSSPFDVMGDPSDRSLTETLVAPSGRVAGTIAHQDQRLLLYPKFDCSGRVVATTQARAVAEVRTLPPAEQQSELQQASSFAPDRGEQFRYDRSGNPLGMLLTQKCTPEEPEPPAPIYYSGDYDGATGQTTHRYSRPSLSPGGVEGTSTCTMDFPFSQPVPDLFDTGNSPFNPGDPENDPAKKHALSPDNPTQREHDDRGNLRDVDPPFIPRYGMIGPPLVDNPNTPGIDESDPRFTNKFHFTQPLKYEYNLDNLPRRILRPGGVVGTTSGLLAQAPSVYAEFTYDALGRRASATYDVDAMTRYGSGGVKLGLVREWYTFDEFNRLIAVHRQDPPTPGGAAAPATPRLHERYVYHARGLDGVSDHLGLDRVAVRLRDADGDPANGLEEVIYPVTNSRGDVTALLDEQGKLLGHIRYTTHGVPAWREASIADIADNGSNLGPDGLLDNGDFGLFIAAFFAANDDESGACDGSTIPCSPADIADNATMPGGDGFVDNGDFSAFIVSFFADKPRMARNELSSIGLLSSVSTRPSGALNGLDWRHGFAGYLYDTHLGVYHVRARTYDPRLGRWLQRDPIGYAGGWNLYEYTNGDPLSFVDPFGWKASRYEWNHLLPQAVFKDRKIPGMSIHDSQFGLLMTTPNHRGKDGECKKHRAWNDELGDWVKSQDEAKKPITKKSIEEKLSSMSSDPKYKSWLEKGVPAPMGYNEWGNVPSYNKSKVFKNAQREYMKSGASAIQGAAKSAKATKTGSKLVKAGAKYVPGIGLVIAAVGVSADAAEGKSAGVIVVNSLSPISVDDMIAAQDSVSDTVDGTQSWMESAVFRGIPSKRNAEIEKLCEDAQKGKG